ncbi:hypothetical protein PsAD13_03204 [Pseudovibrio sp. Ad13]|uniref:hypothetical protein n=1 Tax=Pseudovibrio sp. Ad13 TaxID=989396 RepID=UPI0007AE9F7B|nr:hypothetical protein [Pseudovibrio sp. Ad13]KZK83002.1 hypothetical protein PsAD13_03204 [Pseudovibrio sp. Ad13]
MYLALDLGVKTGWARWEPGLSKPVSGVFDCGAKDKAGGYGGRSLSFYGWLLGKIESFGVTHLAIEDELPAISGKPMNRGNEQWQPAQHRLCEMAAVANQIPYQKITMQKWRKHFIGRSVAPRGVKNGRAWIKQQAIQRCKLLGWDPKDDNEAEALALMDFFRSTQSPSYAVQTTDLFTNL